ncbi:RING1 and YY1-binding protein [Pteropus medius]|uniref:RING1 and YY1-binding protein n=1 Tax=Pteropus vampyrus TaxID=132908 RepID=UPI00196A896D|nr:RING1 and YY1-binding protein [Pteropus giganteus]
MGHVRPTGLARSAAPGCGAPGRHARPQRAHTPGHAHRRPGPRPPRHALPRASPPPPFPPRGAGHRLPIGRTVRDARRPAPPLVSHSAEAALAGTSLVRRLAAAAAASAAAGARAPAAEGGRLRWRSGGGGRRRRRRRRWRGRREAVSLPLGAGGRARRSHGGSSLASLRRRHSSQTKGDLTRPKRQAKPAADEGFWDCSVCTFRNSAEAFKCSICDVRKGTSTRKPRINSQLVAQQVAQQYATPPPPKKEKKEKIEKQDKEKPEKDKEISPSITKKNTNKKTKPKSDILKDPPSEANSIQSANATTKTSETNHTSRPRLKNVDRSTAQQLAVTVGNVTVIITDFKEKTRSSSTSSSTVTSSAGSEQQNQSSSGSESTDKGSSRSSTPKGDMSAVNDESF